MFAGIMRFPQNRDGDFYHEWDSRDLKAVQELCEENRAYLDIEPIDMETYEKSVEGTQDLRSDLYELYEESYDEEDVARYILGCLIYHQLLYCNPLHVHYET